MDSMESKLQKVSETLAMIRTVHLPQILRDVADLDRSVNELTRRMDRLDGQRADPDMVDMERIERVVELARKLLGERKNNVGMTEPQVLEVIRSGHPAG